MHEGCIFTFIMCKGSYYDTKKAHCRFGFIDEMQQSNVVDLADY